MSRRWLGFAGLLLCLGFSTVATAAAKRDADLGRPPPGFVSATARVDGAAIHYVRGGRGPAVVLIHGFPQDWVEYRAIMPRLARRFTVVAVDLPGVGKSAPSAVGYAAATRARQIHDLATRLALARPYIVGHDLGGITAYAYVRQFPADLRGAMILDVPIPGVGGWEAATKDAWHIGFIQTPGLAEKLVPGRQDAFLGWALDQGRFTPAQRAYYFSAYGPAQLHAGFEMYRAFPADAKWNQAHTAPNATPVVIAIGERSFFAPFAQTFADGYRARGLTDVRSATAPGSGHYLLADNPEAVAALIERHAVEGR